MNSKPTYWIGKRPSQGKKWAYTDHAEQIEDPDTIEAVFHMYQRYVKQWNDIELDNTRSLEDHTQTICGAKTTSDTRRFIVIGKAEPQIHWVLEIWYARGFRSRYPGGSCALNALRSQGDIKSLYLHFTHGGREAFADWVQREARENRLKGEWTQYK